MKTQIPPEIKPTHVESKPEGLEVQCMGPLPLPQYPSHSRVDVGPSSHPHTSLYPWSWLRYNSYDPPMKRAEKPECVSVSSRLLLLDSCFVQENFVGV